MSSHAEWIFEILIGPGTIAVEGETETVNAEFGHKERIGVSINPTNEEPRNGHEHRNILNHETSAIKALSKSNQSKRLARADGHMRTR